MTYDIKAVNKWALTERLKTGPFYSFELGDATWYLDNYCARAVPTACAYIRVDAASETVTRKLGQRLTSVDEVKLTNTGTMRSNGKHLVCIYRTPDGAEVGVRDDHVKLIGKGEQLYAAASSPGEGLLVVRGSDGIPLAMFPPVKIPEVAG